MAMSRGGVGPSGRDRSLGTQSNATMKKVVDSLPLNAKFPIVLNGLKAHALQ